MQTERKIINGLDKWNHVRQYDFKFFPNFKVMLTRDYSSYRISKKEKKNTQNLLRES